MSSSTHTTFMTGATGFLGMFVLRDLLGRGRRVVAMVREPFEANCERLRDHLSSLGADVSSDVAAGRLGFVRGFLPNGLPGDDVGDVDDVLSCAASLQLFSNGNAEPFRTNVEGVASLLDWTRGRDIKQVHAVSTAYVSGSRPEVIREEFHHPKPTFSTEYERSKWEAELLFAAWGREDGHQLTIHRPGILVGDSQTGFTTQYGGFYQFARMVGLLADRYRNGDNGEGTHIPLRIPGYPNDPQNIVPVDFAAKIIATVMMDDTLHERIYHLTDPSPPTNDLIKHYLEEYYHIHGGYFTNENRTVSECTPAESLLWEQYHVVNPIVTHNPHFDQANTVAVMQANDIAFPSMDRQRFFRLIDYAVGDRWGQRSNVRAVKRS